MNFVMSSAMYSFFILLCFTAYAQSSEVPVSNDQQSPHGDMTGEVSPDTSSDACGTDDNVPVSHFDKPSYDPDLYLASRQFLTAITLLKIVSSRQDN